MSDGTAKETPKVGGVVTVAEIVHAVQPMGDLDQFGIEDLTAEEEAEFFRILEEA